MDDELRQIQSLSEQGRIKRESQYKEDTNHSLAQYARSVHDYLKRDFAKDTCIFQNSLSYRMGFRNIDKHLTLFPGLAVLGAESGLGKTTFCCNVADNLITGNKDMEPVPVIYITLEQNMMEITSKFISKRCYQEQGNKALTNLQIKCGVTDSSMGQVLDKFSEDAKNLTIISQCDFRVSIDDIEQYMDEWMTAHKGQKKPVVIIDYLQLVQPSRNDKYIFDSRDAVDSVITGLKRIQSKYKILIIAVSAFNRSNYRNPANFTAFKESGKIEYTCDYVWCLQLSILDEDNKHFYGIKNPAEQIAEVEKAKRGNKKQISFVSLKNRNQEGSFTAHFDYQMDHDCFIENEQVSYKVQSVYKTRIG